MTTSTDPVRGPTRAQSQRHRLDPMRGIFVSLGLGAAGWLVIATMVLVLRALVS